MKDQFYVDLEPRISENRKLILYHQFKTKLYTEIYLDVFKIRKFRSLFASFRIACHPLEIEKGSHYNIEKDLRICKACTVENEYHFLLIYPYYRDIREIYLPIKYILNPNLHKLKVMLQIC